MKRSNKDDEGVARPPYSLMTGFIGTASISEALSVNGQYDVAYGLLTQKPILLGYIRWPMVPLLFGNV